VVSRQKTRSEFTVGDLLFVAAGAGLGLVLGYFAAERVGRVNSRRVAMALERWKGRHARSPDRWTEEDSEHLEARVLDALRRDTVLGRRAVRVRVFDGGIVELSGRVAHPSEVALAGGVVQAVAEVRTVLNHLLVGGADAPGPVVTGPSTPKAARG
jgi:hypothetical protein